MFFDLLMCCNFNKRDYIIKLHNQYNKKDTVYVENLLVCKFTINAKSYLEKHITNNQWQKLSRKIKDVSISCFKT